MRKLLLTLVFASVAFTQAADSGPQARFRQEEAEHSQLMRTLHVLTDRYGPRLAGSPNYDAAARWVVSQLNEWGFKNAHLEPWDFGRPGWLNERASAFIVAPVKQNLKFEVVAWTPSTKGAVTASVVQLDALPQGPLPTPPADAAGRGGRGPGRAPARLQPTKEQMNQWLEANQDKVRGKIVMIGKAAVIAPTFNPQPLRRADEQIKAQYDPNNPNAGRGGFGFGAPQPPDPNRVTLAQIDEMVGAWLRANGAVARIEDSAMDHGVIRVAQHRAYNPDKTVPGIMLRNDDYGRIERLLADKEDVKVELNIVNHDYPEGKTTYNVIGEIPGSDKAEEVVMLGGHLDSWHSATGATDNGIGSAIMLEAARLIQSMGRKPRRTIRVALWSGEEEGLLGSLAYVKQHFGSFENPKPEFAKLDCYFNVDTGTGSLRGASIFGPPEAAAMLRKALEPFGDLGVAGAMPSSSRVTAGTDSTSFNNAGLPGIGFQQDPIEYNTLTHHTNVDTYERIIPEDVRNAAVVVAGAVWDVANQEQMIPRFTKDKMPAPVEAR